MVLVEADRITLVGANDIKIPTNTRVIDLRPLNGIAGLIDVHTHMTFYWDKAPGTRPWEQLDAVPSVVTVFLAQENARKTLESGVTTVRDLGSWDGNDLAMKNLIDPGAMVGPRMFVAGCGLHISDVAPRAGVVEPVHAAPTVLQRLNGQLDSKSPQGRTGSRCSGPPEVMRTPRDLKPSYR